MKTSRLFLIGTAIISTILTAFPAHAAEPPMPTLISPAGKTAGSSITFQWNAISGATRYQLQVKTGSTVKLNMNFTADQANCSEGTGICSAQATVGNGASALSWTVRARNAEGFGAWSEAKNFTMTDEMRTPISKLPFTIYNSGSYYVTGNLASDANGIIVAADNVAVDLNGYTLTGPGSGSNHGIYMNGRKNVEIRNGTIEKFGTNGVYEADASGARHRVIGVRANNNGYQGIALSGKQHLVDNCSAGENGYCGIYAGYYSIIRDCACAGNDSGINAGGGCVVSGNSSIENSGTGIGTLSGCIVVGNTVRDNAHGIYAADYSTIKNNVANYNDYTGIDAGDYSVLDGNTAYNNNLSGSGSPNIDAGGNCQWGINVH